MGFRSSRAWSGAALPAVLELGLPSRQAPGGEGDAAPVRPGRRRPQAQLMVVLVDRRRKNGYPHRLGVRRRLFQLELALDEVRIDLAGKEGGVIHDLLVEGDGGGDADRLVLPQGALHASASGGPVGSP